MSLHDSTIANSLEASLGRCSKPKAKVNRVWHNTRDRNSLGDLWKPKMMLGGHNIKRNLHHSS